MLKLDSATTAQIEQKILSTLILEDGAKIQRREETDAIFTALEPRDFVRPEHTVIFDVAKKIWKEQGFVPEVMLRVEVFKEIGGGKSGRTTEMNNAIDSILDVQDTFPFDLAIQLLPDLKRLKIERELPSAIERTIKAAETIPYSEAAEKYLRPLIDDTGVLAATINPVITAETAFEEKLKAIEAGKISLEGKLPLGFATLDSLLRGGLKAGQLFIIGARPAVGKTTFALNVVLNTLLNDLTARVAFASLEQTAPELLTKMVSAVAHQTVPETDVELRHLLQTDKKAAQKFRAAREKIDTSRLNIIETCRGIADLAQQLEKIKREQGLNLVVIDYLQLIPISGARSRYEGVTEISNTLKRLAKTLRVPVICLAQVNRNNENANRPPRLSDLRDSGSIEQDADIAALIYEQTNNTEEEKHIAQQKNIIIDVAKNRNGAVYPIALRFSPRLSLFEEYPKNF